VGKENTPGPPHIRTKIVEVDEKKPPKGRGKKNRSVLRIKGQKKKRKKPKWKAVVNEKSGPVGGELKIR